MNKVIQAFVVIMSLFMVSCTVEDSSSFSYSETNYTRTLSKGDNASMQCNVYVDDGRVAVVLELDYPMYNSSETIKIETRAGTPSVYTVDVEATGVLLDDIESFCTSIANSLAKYDGKTECSETEVHGVEMFANVTTAAAIDYVVSTSIEDGREKCDSWYDSYKKVFQKIPGEWGGDIEKDYTGEKASSCDVSLETNLLTVSITYPDKTALMQMAVSDGIFSVLESYTGLDNATLSNICRSYQNDPEIRNVVCQDSYFAYSLVEYEGSLEDEAVNQKKEVCPALLSGELTLEDLW